MILGAIHIAFRNTFSITFNIAFNITFSVTGASVYWIRLAFSHYKSSTEAIQALLDNFRPNFC